MPEYIGCKPQVIDPGETVIVNNLCGGPVEVGTGLIFRENGNYFVAVNNGKISVCKINPPIIPKHTELNCCMSEIPKEKDG